MSDENEIAKLKVALAETWEQLQLTMQWVNRLEATLNVLTDGQFMRIQSKPGEESKMTDLPVPDDAPMIRLHKAKIPMPSKILARNGRVH